MFLSKQKKGGIVYLYLIESSYDRETHTRRKKSNCELFGTFILGSDPS